MTKQTKPREVKLIDPKYQSSAAELRGYLRSMPRSRIWISW